MCQRTKRRFQKHRKFPNFYSTNQLNKGLLEKETTSQQRQSNNILEQFSDHLIFFFLNYQKCVNFSGSKGPFSKYLFYSRFDEAFYSALRLAVAGSSRSINNERYSSPQ